MTADRGEIHQGLGCWLREFDSVKTVKTVEKMATGRKHKVDQGGSSSEDHAKRQGFPSSPVVQ